MNWKEFLKPDWDKITLVLVFVLALLLILISGILDWPCCYCQYLKTGLDAIKCSLLASEWDLIRAPQYLITLIGVFYLLSCLIVRFIRRKKVKS